jgi:hypothetical protein
VKSSTRDKSHPVAALDPEGESDVADDGSGDLWCFPNGHAPRLIADHGC